MGTWNWHNLTGKPMAHGGTVTILTPDIMIKCPLPAVGMHSNNSGVMWHAPAVWWIFCLYRYFFAQHILTSITSRTLLSGPDCRSAKFSVKYSVKMAGEAYRGELCPLIGKGAVRWLGQTLFWHCRNSFVVGQLVSMISLPVSIAETSAATAFAVNSRETPDY